MKQAQPRMTIGLPVYNGENYLAQALDSILNQTFSDFELIISDNGSTDKTEQICRTYAAKDSRIKYLRHEQNMGAAKNFNIFFDFPLGEYFKWWAHDDMCAPEFLEQCVTILDHQPNVVISYPRTTFIDEHSQPQGQYADNLDLRSPHPSERLHKFFDNPGWCHPVFGVIRTDILRQTQLIGNYPRSDRNLIGELILYGECHEIPAYLFLRRLHPEISTTVNVTETQLAAWFDPKKAGQRVFPRWRRFYEYVRAISRAPLSWSDRLGCYLELGRFVLIPKRWAGLVDDLVQATGGPAVLLVLIILMVFSSGAFLLYRRQARPR